MKKLLIFVSVFVFMFVTSSVAHAVIGYKEALGQNKLIAILVYADWADDIQPVLQNFYALEPKYSDKYNFVALNIADEQTKEFNKIYHIYPKLPYVLLFKDQGRVSRYLQKDCILDTSCITGKMDIFTN